VKKIGTEKSPFSEINQAGVVIMDMDKAIEYYSSLGIEPFEPLQVTAVDRKIYGKPADDVKIKVRRLFSNPLKKASKKARQVLSKLL